jgi:Tfp pilus assembly protein PilN
VSDIKFEGDNKIKIQGVCDSYQEVTEIEDALSKSKIFESVTRNQTGNTVDGKTKFELALVLKSEA